MDDLLENRVQDLIDLGMSKEDAIACVNDEFLDTLNNHYSEN